MLRLGVNAKLPFNTKDAAIMCVSLTMLETIDLCTMSMLHKKLQKKKGNNCS